MAALCSDETFLKISNFQLLQNQAWLAFNLMSLEPGASMLEAAPCRSLCLRPWGSSLLHSSMISEDKTGISRPALILFWSLEKAERRELTPLSRDKSGPQGAEGKWLTLQMILREDLQSFQIPIPIHPCRLTAALPLQE